MKTNLIIGSEDLASRILLSRLPAAQLIPGKDILGQFFGIFLVGDDTGHQDEYLLAVCVEKMLVKSSLSPQDALDDMSLVVFHFVC